MGANTAAPRVLVMHGLVQRRLLPLLLLPMLAGAQEPSGLEKAKQDLKTLPAMRNESERTGLRLPSIATPGPVNDVATPPPVSRHTGGAAAETEKAKASGNWLVDAMMKEEARTSGRKAGRDGDDRAGTDRDDVKDPLTDTRRTAEADRGALGTRDRDTALVVDNPLAPFMADWISKRDQALLLPKAVPSLGDPREGLGAQAGPVGEPTTITFPGLEARPDAATGAALRPTPENPFLQAVLPPEKPAPAAAPAPAPSPIGNDRTLAPPEPARESRPPPPIDLSKPSQDAKYFPQLKRF